MANEVKIYGIREDNKCFEKVIPLSWIKSVSKSKSDLTSGDVGSAYIEMQNLFGKNVDDYTVECIWERIYNIAKTIKRTPIPVKGDLEEVLQSKEMCCYWSTSVDSDKNVTLHISISQEVYNQMGETDLLFVVLRRYKE